MRTLGEIQVPAMDLGTRETRIISLRDVEISATDITYVRSREDQAWEPLRCALVLKDGTVWSRAAVPAASATRAIRSGAVSITGRCRWT